MNKKKKTQPQKGQYDQHRELVSLLFRFPKHKLLSLNIRMVVKMKKESSFSFVEKELVCHVLKLLKLAHEFIFTSPKSNIFSMSCRRFNYIT